MTFIQFCEMCFKLYGDTIDGNELLRMCEVAYKELREEEDAA